MKTLFVNKYEVHFWLNLGFLTWLAARNSSIDLVASRALSSVTITVGLTKLVSMLQPNALPLECIMNAIS
jgi:hypothetical protein